MTTATIDNPPVAEVITASDTVTVPSNEVWKVTVTIAPATSSFQDFVTFLVDGQKVAAVNANVGGGGNHISQTLEYVFVGGQVLSVDSIEDGNAYVSGFVVNENYTP